METIKNFWIKLILVLLPLFIIGFVNAVIIYENQKHLSKEMLVCQETKVNNEVLLQYIQLHKQIHEAMKGNIEQNSDQIKRLEKKLDDFIQRWLTANTRGDESYIMEDEIYNFYVKNGINPFHM